MRVGQQDGDNLVTSSTPTWESYHELAAGELMLVVHHVPTVDHVNLPPEQLREIRQTLSDLLTRGRIVLVGCSAAMGRTRDVLRGFAAAR